MAKSSSSYSAPATQKNFSKKSFGGRLLPSHGGLIDRGRPWSADQQDGTAYDAQENQNDRDLRADRKRICLRLGAIGMINQFALRLIGSARLSRWSHDRDSRADR